MANRFETNGMSFSDLLSDLKSKQPLGKGSKSIDAQIQDVMRLLIEQAEAFKRLNTINRKLDRCLNANAQVRSFFYRAKD